MAGLMANLPHTTCMHSIIASKIESGVINIGIGGGVENMSIWDMRKMVVPEDMSPTIMDFPQAKDCILPMGITSENLAAKYGITREEQDQFAVSSHKKAAAA